MPLSVNSSAEEFIVTVWGPAASFWICVVIMALLADHGHHHFCCPWSICGTVPVLVRMLSYQPCCYASFWLIFHEEQHTVAAPRQSLTMMLSTSPLKTRFCSSVCERIYSCILQEISWIWIFSDQTMGDKRNIMFIQAKTVRKLASYGIWLY